MEGITSSPIRKKKKTLNACQRCRGRKIRCSGQDPCQHCASRNLQCVFKEQGKKLVVSEEYLHELQNRASALEGGPSAISAPVQSSPLTSPTSVRFSGDGNNDRRANSLVTTALVSPSNQQQQQSTSANPLRFIPRPTYDVGSNGRPSDPVGQGQVLNNEDSAQSPSAIGDEYRRFGHSSSWSFSRRIRNMINNATEGPGLHDTIPIQDGAYGVPWRQKTLDLSGLELPMEDYAEYLTNTTSFAMGSLYYLYDKTAFLKKLRQFYADRLTREDQGTGLWHIQMLVVFAFGRSILAREAGRSGPVGSIYFARAVEGLPDCHRLCQEPILSIEILCMFALFMQAMDMRLAAYEYIGQAMRIGVTNGLNREFDCQRITRAEYEHRSKLWWTVYIIERKLSSLIGVPPSLQDVDIALPAPSIDTSTNNDMVLAFHVELSVQLGQILNVVYGSGIQRQLGGKFIAEIQSILQRLADTSVMLNTSMKIELQRPTDTISRAAASLHLLHHQCSILAIRPVFFFLLERKLATNNSQFVLSDAVIGLLRVCVESAIQVLKIVEALRSHRLVDLLLPFDLDSLFASAFVLLVVDIITPAAAEQWDLCQIFTLMDEMATRGLVIAGPYKKDLSELNDLRQRLKSVQQADLPPPRVEPLAGNPAVVPDPGMGAGAGTARQDPPLDPNIEQHLIWSWMATNDHELGGLHPDTIQSAIDGLNFDFLNNDETGFGGSEWMWGSNWPENG